MLALALAVMVGASPLDKPIDLDVRDAEVKNVLTTLADIAGVNIVISDATAGRVTLKLRKVPWRKAFAMVLSARGLGFERDGEVFYVDTLEALASRAEQRARIAESKRTTARLVTRIIPVSYARAEELAAIVQSMLSERGKLVVDKRTNTLIVTDVEEVIERVSASFE